ncbi:hypothetical protein ACJJTC_004361 [Scirpophaga incertulas]
MNENSFLGVTVHFLGRSTLGTILDPRFKNLHFQDANACGRAIQKLKNIIKDDIASTSGSEEEQEIAHEDFDFWSHHKQLAVGQKRRRGKHLEKLIFLGSTAKSDFFS